MVTSSQVVYKFSYRDHSKQLDAIFVWDSTDRLWYGFMGDKLIGDCTAYVTDNYGDLTCVQWAESS